MTEHDDSRDSRDDHEAVFTDESTRSVVVTSDGLGAATGEIEQETVIDQVQAGRLVVEEGPDAGREFEVRGIVRVGRARDNDVMLVDAGVGRSHLLITSDHGMWRMRDLKSANGTRLNGSYISGSTPIFHGDRIKMGRSTLRFETRSGSFAEHTAADTMPNGLGTVAFSAPEELLAEAVRTSPGEQMVDGESKERRRMPAGTPVTRDLIGDAERLSTASPMLGTSAATEREEHTVPPTAASGDQNSDLLYSARILLFAGGWAAAVVLLALLIRLLR